MTGYKTRFIKRRTEPNQAIILLFNPCIITSNSVSSLYFSYNVCARSYKQPPLLALLEAVDGYSLCGRVVQLVLSGAGEAALHPGVCPQPPDDTGQVIRHDALLLRAAGQGKELAGIILQGATEMCFTSFPTKRSKSQLNSRTRIV